MTGFFTGLPKRQPPKLTPLDLSRLRLAVLDARVQACMRRMREASVEVQAAWERVDALRAHRNNRL